jgi:NADH dehydrogenase
MRIAVNGSSGFVGNHVVNELIDQGHAAICIVRNERDPKDDDFLRSIGGHVERLDLAGGDPRVIPVLAGCEGLVHLIGSIAPKKGERLHSLHAGMGKYFFESARKARVSRVVMVSALGAGEHAPSMYHRTKWLAEEELRKAGVRHVILRPGLIVGRRVGRRDSKLVRRYLNLIETKTKVPLLYGGRNRVQPIFVTDLAKAIVASFSRDDLLGKTLELAGGEVTTIRGLVETLMDVVGKNRPTKSIPTPLAYAVASVAELAQETPILSKDQLKIAQMDAVAEDNALVAEFEIAPTPLREALNSYQSEK